MNTGPVSTRTEGEFVAWADELRHGNAAEMPFVWAIMRSLWVGLHWSLIRDETLGAGIRRSLLSTEQDAAEHPADAILALAKMCDPLLNGLAGRAEVRDIALRLLNAERIDGKGEAVIALGWVGNAADFDLLGGRVRADNRAESRAESSPECRVAAIGALVQLLERHPGEGTRATVELALRSAMNEDHDPLVRETAVEALQQRNE